tara:strand:+ start:503 stop:1843 length:1341 start_codon:yes stop_codon:yes gene_type:complete
MIPSTAQLSVEMSLIDYQQGEKNRWLKSRDKAYDYYKGRTEAYTKAYFEGTEIIKEVSCPNINITKRIIDRISLVYMKAPLREYSNENTIDFFYQKDFKMQRAEKLCNLLECILIKPTWRNEHIEYDIIRDWEPLFGDDPLNPYAITYPLQVRSSVMDTTPELWAYWDEEHHFIYEKGTGKKMIAEDNPEMWNPYGILPFVKCYRDGQPEASYFDTDASPDLIATNEQLNQAAFNMYANNHYQSFGYGYITGSNIEKEKLDIGQDKWSFLGHDGSLNMVAPPNSTPALVESLQFSYRMLAQNYHLSISFVDGTSAESGVALRLRNQELMDSRRSDVERWKMIEQNIFAVEERIIMNEVGKDAGFLYGVDYEESTEILSNHEQREEWDWQKANGLTDNVAILMQMDADKYPDEETAQEYLDKLAERSVTEEETETASPLLAALTSPV